ncbi:MAG TPA: bifunctional DNA-formamidopyrimidine glycosylase/DNA-(apurinic or apyrimidinic site) lyase [Caulobacteraceae bacterium]|jgi:formamidopyrimidine-DNA glycosylase
MPELPEVETVRRGLALVLEGHRLLRVQARRPDLRFPLTEGFGQRLTGAGVERLDRRAKYLRGWMSTGDVLVMHLGMTGRFEIDSGGRARPGAFREPASTVDKHAHVVFETDAGTRITFFDARRFGYMAVMSAEEMARHPWFRSLGPEPLGPEFDGACLARAFAGKTQSVKAALLDQRVVAGLGNIYVCEALHRTGISPVREAGRISRARLDRLTVEIKAVLAEAIEAGGSTLRDYAAVDGALGYFQHRFQAYGREGQPCTRTRCQGVLRRTVQSGRSTFHCPVCQR